MGPRRHSSDKAGAAIAEGFNRARKRRRGILVPNVGPGNGGTEEGGNGGDEV